MEDTGIIRTLTLEPHHTEGSEPHVQQHCLRYILNAMKIAGCYTHKYSEADLTQKQKCLMMTSIVYRYFVFCLLLFSIVRTFYTFFTIPRESIYGQAITFTWIIAATLNFLICQKANSERFGNMNKVFDACNDLIPQMVNMGIFFKKKSFRRKQIAACIGAATIITMVTLFDIFQYVKIYESSLTGNLEHPFGSSIYLRILQTFCVIAVCMQTVIPAFYAITISVMLKENFSSFNEFLKKWTCENNCEVPDNMNDMRKVHLKLCTITSDFDKDLGYLYANTFFWNVSIGLFILYMIVKLQIGLTADLIGYLNWLVLALALLTAMSMFAAMVHEEVTFMKRNYQNYWNSAK